MILLRWLILLLGSLNVTLTVLLFWVYLFLLRLAFVLGLPPLENSDHVDLSVYIDFPVNSKQDAPFHCIAHGYSRADWVGLCDDLGDVPWEDVFKLSVSAATSKFC